MSKKLARMIVTLVAQGEVPRTLLSKMLFLADSLAMTELGKSMSNAVYVKTDHGPQPIGIEQARDGLIEDGVLWSRPDLANGFLRQVLSLGRVAPDGLQRIRATFTSDELDVLDRIAEAFGSQSPLVLSQRLLGTAVMETADWYEAVDLSRVGTDSALRRLLAPAMRQDRAMLAA